MIEEIDVYRVGSHTANIKQTSIKREWMDNTYQSHAYRCFPMSIANTLGYEISFPEDISFTWDGILDSSSEHVKILSGPKSAHSGRGHGTVSLETNLVIKTSEDITMLQMPVPNYFIDGVQCFTTLISTSFLNVSMPLALRVTRPNAVITIPANTPVTTLVPISLKQISNIQMNVYNGFYSKEFETNMREYGEESQKINKTFKWTGWYRDAINHKGESIGRHELKSLKLKINDYTDQPPKVIK